MIKDKNCLNESFQFLNSNPSCGLELLTHTCKTFEPPVDELVYIRVTCLGKTISHWAVILVAAFLRLRSWLPQ